MRGNRAHTTRTSRGHLGLTGAVFLLVFAAGCGLALARHPIYGLMTYVAVFYLHPPARWWGQALPDLRWSLTASLITLIAVLVHKPKAKTLPLFSHGFVTGLLIFVVWVG